MCLPTHIVCVRVYVGGLATKISIKKKYFIDGISNGYVSNTEPIQYGMFGKNTWLLKNTRVLIKIVWFLFLPCFSSFTNIVQLKRKVVGIRRKVMRAEKYQLFKKWIDVQIGFSFFPIDYYYIFRQYLRIRFQFSWGTSYQ